MATRNSAKYFAAALLAAACTVQNPTDTQAPTLSEPVASSQMIPAQATIQVTEETATLIENGMLLDGTVSLERVFPDAGPFEERTRRAGLHRFYKAVLSDQKPMTKAVADLSELPGVVSVTPVHQIEKRAAFNDPLLSKQWHMVSSNGDDINVQGVWERYTTGSSQVIVSVVDEPVDASHPDLQANLWKDELGRTGYNFARNSWDLSIHPEGELVSGVWYNGDSGHGTHVAGVIAAVNNNGIGLCGIAGGDYSNNTLGVRLQSSAIFSAEALADNATSALAIKWGADHGAVISQNSWGFSYTDDIKLEDWMASNIDNSCPEIRAAVDYFIQYAGCDNEGNQLPDSPMKGGLVIFAAGNDNVPWDIISTYEPIIAVGAYGRNLNRASYSNYGPWVDIAAPGGEPAGIWSTLPYQVNDGGRNGGHLETTDWYGGEYWMGTSMACPHVSGVAALIISYFGGPGFTADAAKEILFAGLGEALGGDKNVGRKLNALASFEYGVQHYPAGGNVDDQKPPVLELDQDRITVKAHEEVTVGFVAYDPNGDKVTLTLEAGSHALTLDNSNNRLVIGGWKDNPGTYTATLTASDGARFTKAQLEYTLLPNHAPQVKGTVDNILLTGLQRVGSVSIADTFSDEDGEKLSINAVSSNTGCVSVSADETRVLVTPVGYGTATVTITASDFNGEDVSVSFQVAVLNPDQPVTVTPELPSTDAYISIETENPVPVKVKLYSSTGSLVMETEMKASAFSPIHLDVSALAPGRYTAVLEYEGQTRQLRIIKY